MTEDNKNKGNPQDNPPMLHQEGNDNGGDKGGDKGGNPGEKPPEGGDKDPKLSKEGGKPGDGLTDVPDFKVAENEKHEFDPSFFNEDGSLNKEGMKTYIKDRKESDEKYEKRILDLRRKVSDGKAPNEKEEYFQDYAPAERFMKYFDAAAPDAPLINEFKETLSNTYMEAGLTKRQGEDVSNTLLKVLEKIGVLDTRTKQEKYADKQKWIETQKSELGANADNIIREARIFIESAPIFAAKTKNQLIELMESLGAPFVDTIYQLKEAYGNGTGGVPSTVSGLAGLKSDVELLDEYKDPKTSDMRKQEIIIQRHRAGRKGNLFDAKV